MAAVVDPAGHGRHMALRQGTPQDRLGESVDLEQDHAGDVGAVPPARLARAAADDTQRPGVGVETDHRSEQHLHQREEEGNRNCPQQGRMGPIDDRQGERDDDPVEDQRAEAECEDRQRQRDPDQERPEDRVEDRDRRRRKQRRAEARHPDARDDRRQHQEGERGQHPERQAPEDARGEPVARHGRAARSSANLAPGSSTSTLTSGQRSAAIRANSCGGSVRVRPRVRFSPAG